MGQSSRDLQDVFHRLETTGRDLNAVVTVTRERAEALARVADDRVGSGRPPRPLEGVPFVIKDVVDVAGYPTLMGSDVRVGGTAEASAPVITVLEEAGGLPVAKTNCQEFSYGILGEESAFGRVVNPVDPELCTGGSSSGSAALVAADVVPLAVGTDTAGSVRVPAACTGVIGFKPTPGTVPIDGVFPLAPSFDTVGFFAKDIALIERAYGLFAGDEEGLGAAPGAGQGGRLSVDTSLLLNDAEAPSAAREFVSLRRKFPSLDVSPVEATVSRTDVVQVLDHTLDLYDIIRRVEAYRIHRELVADQRERYQPGVLGKILSGAEVTEDQYESAVQDLEQLRESALAIFEETDLLVTPAIAGEVVRWADLDSGSAARFMRYTAPFNVLGWPAITIPVPRSATVGTPLSVQIVGQPGADEQVLRFANRLVSGKP
ncbi:amidase [Brevibacterium daeguense]|uniref:Amidase n=1 Tax=Brevibacterium daeguense TaxID=909936 RepID=A0ABP8EFR4_9MICO|nr:amidase [Brevibacterium daeguense]